MGRNKKCHLIKIPNESEPPLSIFVAFKVSKAPLLDLGTPTFDDNNAQSMRKKINSDASRAFKSSERKFQSQSILRCRKRRELAYIYRVRR